MKVIFRSFLFINFSLFLIFNSHTNALDISEVPLEHKERMKLLCPCEFYESIPSANEGSYGSGPMVLLIADNEKTPYALININGEIIKLRPSPYTPYKCNIGENYRREWKFDKIGVEIDLITDQPGAEACWFKGRLKVSSPNENKTISIKGACGC